MCLFTPGQVLDLYLGNRDHWSLMKIAKMRESDFMKLSHDCFFRQLVSREVHVTWRYNRATSSFLPIYGTEMTLESFARWACLTIYIDNLEGYGLSMDEIDAAKKTTAAQEDKPKDVADGYQFEGDDLIAF
ncbi:hypothetical protein CDV31_000625 [Fusarium ambrosium]|uniref:Uncharacterized protein n=1 Tax=Fusarium ambrosium TaxID=131363 RepID=A0A428V1J9_9HYPO|nr:hypothetical protein CDV31_000625 [Fusarium ambrosium]